MDLSRAAGCFVVVVVVVVAVVVVVVVVVDGVVGGVDGCCQPVSTSIPASSGPFRARS